jgi:electron transfer flavoprotein alpha subunit
LVRALPGTVSGTRPLAQVDDTTADNIIALRGNTTNPELYIRAGRR